MKSLLTLLRLALCSVCLAPSLSYAADNKTLNLMNWAVWIDPTVISGFEAETGINVNQTFFSDQNMLKAKLLAQNNGLDLVIPTLNDMQQEIAMGLFQPLDKSKIPNYKNLSPALMQIAAEVDPGNKYGVIYDWGTMGIGYNVDMIKKILGPDVEIDDWKFVFDPKYLSKLQGCGIAYYDTYSTIYGLTLFYLGRNPNSKNVADFQYATDYLMGIRKYLTYFSNSNYMFDLASGNLCMVLGYSGDVLRAQTYAKEAGKNINIKFVIPKQGTQIVFDMMAIPGDAPHPDTAYKFINYVLEPKQAAKIANYIFAPGAVKGESQYYNDVLQTPVATPSEAFIKQKLFNINLPPPSINQDVNRLWLEVRYGIKE